MAKQPEAEGKASGAASGAGTPFGRILAIIGVNAALVLATVILASRSHGLPDLNTTTLAVGLLPVSAAMALVLACRRIDFAMPMLLCVAASFRGHSFGVSDDPFYRLAILCGLCAGVGLASALVTWYGRISSALWTGLVAFAFSLVVAGASPAAGPQWPWTAAVAGSLGLLLAGAAVLGATGLVVLPSSPPIIRSGSAGLSGLAGAWMFATASMALASQSEVTRRAITEFPLGGYPLVLAAVAMGGSLILRGRWGAVTAVALTCLGHLTWAFAWSADLGSRLVDIAVPAAAPLAAIPLYLAIDWVLRRRTGESAPTGLLA